MITVQPGRSVDDPSVEIWLAPGSPGGTALTSRDTTIDGRAARITETESAYSSAIDWSGYVLMLTVGGHPGAEYEARKAGLDAIAASVRYVE